MTVAVVIVNYRTAQMTLDCVAALAGIAARSPANAATQSSAILGVR